MLHAPFQAHLFFTHFLASSPSVWWAERDLLGQATARRTRQVALPSRLFLSLGVGDTSSMTSDLALLEAQLARLPFAGLEIFSHRFARRTHCNVIAAAFALGMMKLFGTAKVRMPGQRVG